MNFANRILQLADEGVLTLNVVWEAKYLELTYRSNSGVKHLEHLELFGKRTHFKKQTCFFFNIFSLLGAYTIKTLIFLFVFPCFLIYKNGTKPASNGKNLRKNRFPDPFHPTNRTNATQRAACSAAWIPWPRHSDVETKRGPICCWISPHLVPESHGLEHPIHERTSRTVSWTPYMKFHIKTVSQMYGIFYRNTWKAIYLPMHEKCRYLYIYIYNRPMDATFWIFCWCLCSMFLPTKHTH